MTSDLSDATAGQSATALARADLHLHTNLGDGTASPQRVLEVARQRNLKVIAVTDHDHLEGAKRLQDLMEREGVHDIQLIWGVETTTRDGHFIGLFIRKAPRFLLRAEEAIEQIKDQGGLCVIPHPMGRLVPSLSQRKIDSLLARGYQIDAIETYNPSPANASVRDEVRRLNRQWRMAETGSSDAHFWQHIGAGYTLFPGETADDVRQAIIAHTTREGGQERPPERLPVSAYVAQNVWSLIIDPPRKLSRMLLTAGHS
ncbi:MAG: PHP domain-containing protein [Chloroflexota bacterium]|nr:PHP domain-containing protein [Chloroflexota bacterium]